MSSKRLDSYFLQNTIGVSSTEFFWGLSMPVLVESTFLQVFLRRLGASSFLVGLIPAILFTGLSLFGLFSGYFTSHLPAKRKAVILTHIIGSLPFPVIGAVLLISGFTSITIPLFFCVYGMFSMLLGFMAPLWQNYVVKIFSERNAVKGLSFMWIVQNISKIISSFLIAKAVDHFGIAAGSSGVIFILVGVFCFIGSFMFFITREGEEVNEPVDREKNFFRHLFLSAEQAFSNRNFIFFIISDFETFAILGVVAFYANYAIEFCGIKAAAATGVFVGLYYIGGFTANFLLGTLNILSLKNKYFYTRFFSFSAVLLLVFLQDLTVFLIVSFFLGFSRSNRSLLYPVAIKRIARTKDATNHFALAYIIQLPVSVGLPLLNGRFLDLMSSRGALSYKLLFLLMAVIIVISMIFLIKTRFPEEHRDVR